MTTHDFEYGKYFEELQRINLTVRLGSAGSFDGTAAITSLKGSLAWLEIFGTEQPPMGTVREGADVSVSVWTGGALCRCDAAVEKVRDDRQFAVRLAGDVREIQRREYFRLDVALPFVWELLPGLTPEEALDRWMADRADFWRQPEMVPAGDGYKVIGWNGSDVSPARVNLSGGGMRFRVTEPVEAGSLLEITLFLALPQPRVVCCLAETIRCHEIALTLERGTHYQLSMKFIGVSDKDRETIISYLFAEQRRALLTKNERFPSGGR
ncbi:PilZ-like domain-containing protein [Geobacter pickeringii]|uniref:Pilus assembly protein PilZ n=1 Tax=Geobacter pickeringii TaxID=345632 RepID=A0A0B5B783_9BACT|nr:PilZ-like domain-containing protein [Geobacter pickeringii]AJE02402.1 pilus assembly protein PilZ [Geobacter pickeringii]